MIETNSISTRPIWKVWGREAAEVWAGGWSRVWPRLWIIVLAIVVGATLVLTISPVDKSLQHAAQVDGTTAKSVAKFLSNYGDLNVTGPLAALVWVLGAAFKKVRWRKLGLACLMGGLLAGLITNIPRPGMGRPRPYTGLADGFYGPHLNGDYQSFPSGHATSSAAVGSVIGASSPILALPGAVFAVSVSWSRMQLDKHHPIDVTVGAIVGTVCGLSFASTVPGAWFRLRRKRRKRKPQLDHRASPRLR
jgi:membrane-associated phospholipid phosphatase